MKQKKCICLVRVSTASQDLAQQTDKVYAEALRCGYTKSNIIIIEDIESAVKLDEEERNGLNRLKKYIENDNSINCVFSYEISRISRKAKVVFSIRDYLISHNVDLIILNPYFKMLKDDGTLSETSNIFFGIFASMAENEGIIRKERLKRGKERKKSMGKFTGGQIPYGYSISKTKEYMVDESKATIIRKIYYDYINTESSIYSLAEQHYKNGTMHYSSVRSYKIRIGKILSYEGYTGNEVYPAIITTDIFNAAKEKRMSKWRPKCKGASINYLSKGMIRDANDDILYSINVYRNILMHPYTYKSFNLELIEKFIWDITKKQQNTKYNKNAKRQQLYKVQKELWGQFNLTFKRQKEVEEKIDRLEERIVLGNMSAAKADELIKRLKEEREDIINMRHQIDYERMDKRKMMKQIENSQEIDLDNLNIEERKDMVHNTIKSIKAEYIKRATFMLYVEYFNGIKENYMMKCIKSHSTIDKVL